MRLGERLDGVLVQEMVRGDIEMMIGALQDPTFGPVIAYGSGGVLLELVADVTFRLHPLTEDDVTDMMSEIKRSALLRGFRGAPPPSRRIRC